MAPKSKKNPRPRRPDGSFLPRSEQNANPPNATHQQRTPPRSEEAQEQPEIDRFEFVEEHTLEDTRQHARLHIEQGADVRRGLPTGRASRNEVSLHHQSVPQSDRYQTEQPGEIVDRRIHASPQRDVSVEQHLAPAQDRNTRQRESISPTDEYSSIDPALLLDNGLSTHHPIEQLAAHLELPLDYADLPQQPQSPLVLYPNPGETLQRIFSHPRVRNLEYRERDFRFKHQLGTGGWVASNYQAAAIQERGRQPGTPCASCAKSKRPGGPWVQCVVMDGFSSGSCANCQYGYNATRCTLRPSKASGPDVSRRQDIALKTNAKRRLPQDSYEREVCGFMGMTDLERDEHKTKYSRTLLAIEEATNRLRRQREATLEEIADGV